MEELFAQRVQGVQRSFIREILKASVNPEVISFAGGLPNPAFFPVDEIKEATARVFERQGASVLQYSNSEGEPGLREYISKRYKKKKGINIPAENIIITNGSQQGVDLLAKVFLNTGDAVIIEEPGYLGAIQSLSLFQPQFLTVPVSETGMDVEVLAAKSDAVDAKLLYMVPSFQNPSGITYTNTNRREVAVVAEKNNIILIEDDPYGELRFSGEHADSFFNHAPEKTVLLGSFSKVVAPGLRLGWVAALPWIHEKLLIAKQASDLHTSSFGQKILLEFLQTNDLDEHIAKITEVYGNQCRAMVEAIDSYFPQDIQITRPEGGMFLWGRLPVGQNSLTLFDEAVKENVVFVPGDPFYTSGGGKNCFRMNYSCVDKQTIEQGVSRMNDALRRVL